jgi:Zn-dependent membrane protease YugP
MHLLIIIGLILVLVFGPTIWVARVMKKHSEEREDFPGTAGELARHLIEYADLKGVSVEVSELPNHYDPDRKVICLSEGTYERRSLTAVVVAVHEFGHALQDANANSLLTLRTRFAKVLPGLQKIGGFLLIAAPVVGLITRAPNLLLLQVTGGLCVMGAALVFHLITLPVELDASFGKAMPLLEQGEYIHSNDLPAARSILWAAAITYVAQSLMSLLNFYAWIRFLR